MALSNRNILVSGAGIAGPALAYWLKRYGFSPTVVELAPKPRTEGYAFHLQGTSGIEVLKRTGVWENPRAPPRRPRLHVCRPEPQSPRPDGLAGRRGGCRAVRSADHHTKNDVEYLFGDPIARLHEAGSGVAVTFESGKQR